LRQRDLPPRLDAVPIGPRAFSLDEYHRLLDGSVLKRGSRTELLEGEVFEPAPRTERQASAIALLRRRLDQSLPAPFALRADEPLTLSNETELSPSLAIVHADTVSRSVRHPASATLVIEVADTDLEHLRGRHVPAYARANVSEVWLVNLVDRRVELTWKPAAGVFQDMMVLDAPDSVSSRALPSLAISFGQLFG
jgi:hypothetical protein